VLDPLRRRGFRLLRAVPAPALMRVARLGYPRYTLGAVCRIEHEGSVLLVKPAYRRGWAMPGGLVGRHESPLEGVRREVREEIGVDVEIVGEPVVVVDPYGRLVDFLYRGVLPPGTAGEERRPAANEIERLGWFPLSDVGTLVHGPDRMAQKLARFDEHPAGGVVVLGPPAGRRSRPTG
jgi:ADP-ribose pyrophosphatase YjhB (NUDIX family)